MFDSIIDLSVGCYFRMEFLYSRFGAFEKLEKLLITKIEFVSMFELNKIGLIA